MQAAIRTTIAILAILSMGAGQLETFKAMPPEERCLYQAWVYAQGVTFRNTGFARDIGNAPIEHYEAWTRNEWDPPKTYMPIFGWAAAEPAIQAMWTALAQLGWDHANEAIVADIEALEATDPTFAGKINSYLTPGHIESLHNEFLKTCVSHIPSGQLRRIGFIKVQSEHLDEFDYTGMNLRLRGCQNNLPLYFDSCFKDPGYSEAQIGARIKECNRETWHKFFNCVQLFPRPTLSEEIESEL